MNVGPAMSRLAGAGDFGGPGGSRKECLGFSWMTSGSCLVPGLCCGSVLQGSFFPRCLVVGWVFGLCFGIGACFGFSPGSCNPLESPGARGSD